jgi:predicted acylesterase/phospholipase RssA
MFAAGYSPSELRDELAHLDFRAFRDAALPVALWNLVIRRGLYPGDTLDAWVDGHLRVKLNALTGVRMMDLPARGIVYASSPTLGILTFDSRGERSEALAAFAVRCSASIPYFFVPQLVDGQRVYDGGLKENFPLDKFLRDNSGKPTVGLYLTSSAKPSRWVFSDMVDTMTTGDDPNTLRKHADKIIPIDPRPIRTTDFDLTADEQRLLILAGRCAARRFLLAREVTDTVTLGDLDALEAQTAALRLEVARRRKRAL